MKEFFDNLSKKQKIIVICIIVGIIAILAVIYIHYLQDDYDYIADESNIYDNSSNIVSKNETEIAEEETFSLGKKESKVIVHVIGEVNNPGVVTLSEGSRIIDAINAAGGKSEYADLSKINLAYILEDGTQLYIPSVNDNRNQEQDNQGQIDYIRSDAGGDTINEGISKDNNNNNQSKVNINNASKEKLVTLPGIGDATAQKILDYREQNGKFKTIEDLKNIEGIGESKFNNIKGLITVK